MFFPSSIGEIVDAASAEMKKQNADFLSKLSLQEAEVLFERGTDFVEVSRSEQSVYLVTSGQVYLLVNERAVLVYEQGDILGIESLLSMPCSSVAKEFAVKAIPIPFSLIESSLGSQALLTLLSRFSSLLLEALSSHLSLDSNLEPRIRYYDEGETIIEQGSHGDEIFTLIEGQADVFVNEHKVGEIKRDEVFGAIAAFTNMQRNASIVATGSALVLGVKKNQLLELIKMRPGTIEKLIGDLGRVIQDLNTQLTKSATTPK